MAMLRPASTASCDWAIVTASGGNHKLSIPFFRLLDYSLKETPMAPKPAVPSLFEAIPSFRKTPVLGVKK